MEHFFPFSVDLQTADGREYLFWSISHWGKDFPERIKSITIDCQCQTKVNEQRIGDALIDASWKKVRKLFNGINEGHPEEIDLAEMTNDVDTVRSDSSEKVCQCKSVEIEQRIEEVTIGESWKRVTRCLLSRLIESYPGEGFLPDMTPIINLIILSGKHFLMKEKNYTENLFSSFIKQIGNESYE